jgi:hypothetical protein
MTQTMNTVNGIPRLTFSEVVLVEFDMKSISPK